MSSPVPTSDADRPFHSRQLSRYLKSPYTALRFGKNRYIGTLANADAKFFSDFAREDFQFEEIIYVENLWKNWDPDSELDPSQPSKISEELTNYVWGLNPEWGIEWPIVMSTEQAISESRASKDRGFTGRAENGFSSGRHESRPPAKRWLDFTGQVMMMNLTEQANLAIHRVGHL
ncbi:hypothetical protein Dimus_001587 [Dionaea muscipula]